MNNKEKALAFITGEKNINAAEAVEILENCDDLYTNDGSSFLTDAEYDSLYQLASRADSTNPYFLGVGSDVRGEKIKLPLPMGSLNQVQEGEIEEWVKDNSLEDEDIVISDKMDGISVCLVYNTAGVFQIALTRGDGYEGQDITRHVKHMKDVPKNISGKMIIRAEIEFAEKAFDKVKLTATRSSGAAYKNARNAIAGMMNSKTPPPQIAYDNTSVLAYDIMGSELSKKDQLLSLKDDGFNVVCAMPVKGKKLNDDYLSQYIADRKRVLDFAIDGIVLDIDSDNVRANMTDDKKADSINPAYAIKYKVLDTDNIREATVKSVEWNLSKHGYAKPKVKLEPFELQGVTISNTTGFNAKYIKDNDIGEGTVVKMTRSGDVIPYILEVTKPTKAEMPACVDDYAWSDNGVDLILKDMNNDEVKIKQLLSWATALDIPNLKEGSVRELFSKGYRTPADVVNINRTAMVAIVGKNGNKIIDGMAKIFSDIPPEKLFGSSPAFSVGLGVRKFKALFKEIDAEKFLDGTKAVSIEDIEAVAGFDEKTALKLINGMPVFSNYLEAIDGKYTLATAKKTTQGMFTGKKICFTGFRDKDLEAAVEAQGGEICSGVSKKTDMLVAVDISGESGKLGKAKDLGIKTISKEDFEKSIDKSAVVDDNDSNEKTDEFFEL